MRPLRNFRANQCCHLISRIVSANFFTARYLTPLAKAGYISAENPASVHSPQRQYRQALIVIWECGLATLKERERTFRKVGKWLKELSEGR